MASIAGLVQLALGMKQRLLVEANLLLDVLVAEDATALATVVATHEETKGLLAARGSADDSRTVRLERPSQLDSTGPECINEAPISKQGAKEGEGRGTPEMGDPASAKA